MVSADYTWDIVEQYHWCFAEVNAGILCASIPALKPFFARYLPGLINSSLNSRGKSDPLKNSGPYNHFDNGRDIKLRPDVMNTTYELHSREDISEELARTKRSQNDDDEVRLWPGNAGNVRRSEIGPVVRASRSFDRSGEGKPNSKAIYVTSETRVDYGRT
jgi:hypothetical protein